MRHVWKRSGIVGGVIVGLLALTVGAVYAFSTAELDNHYAVPDEPVVVPHDTATIARGEHLVRAVTTCVDCHTADLGGKMLIDRPVMAVLSAPNLTSAGVGSRLSDADLVRAIRFGMAPDGRSLVVMPSTAFYYFSDRDLGAVIAYLRTVPPVTRRLQPTSVGPLARVLLVTGKLHLQRPLIDTTAARPQPAPGVTAAYGAYLISIAECKHCHGAGLSGGVPTDNPQAPPAANITPAGIGGWTEADFRTAMREGKRPDGRRLDPFMPVGRYRNMTDEEIEAIWTYLKTVPRKPYGRH